MGMTKAQIAEAASHNNPYLDDSFISNAGKEDRAKLALMSAAAYEPSTHGAVNDRIHTNARIKLKNLVLGIDTPVEQEDDFVTLNSINIADIDEKIMGELMNEIFSKSDGW